jgi:flagellar biosynthetic protein FliO
VSLFALAGAGPELLPTGAASWRALLGILFVFGLLGALAWLARTGRLGLTATRGSRHAVRIESALPLGERRSLVIVTVEGRRLLLGMTPAQVTLVTELAPPPEPATFAETLDSRFTPGGQP